MLFRSADLVEAGRVLAHLGFLPATDGNLSVRLDARRLLVTPAGVRKGTLQPDALCLVDLDGGLLTGSAQPSSELRMHLEVYQRRPDVHAVVHAHPPTATGFAVAGVAIDHGGWQGGFALPALVGVAAAVGGAVFLRGSVEPEPAPTPQEALAGAPSSASRCAPRAAIPSG